MFKELPLFQWLNNIEGDKDFQMCGGCGKRFERKAALHSHAQMCVKRIAVCNSIKDSAKKKEETKDQKKFQKNGTSSESTDGQKRSSRRKPYLLRTYKKPTDMVKKETTEEKTSDICDVNANSKIVENNCDISSKVVTTDGPLIENDVSLPALEYGDPNSQETLLNTSENLENFRGFSAVCEVQTSKIKSEQDIDSESTCDVVWDIPHLQTPTKSHSTDRSGEINENISPSEHTSTPKAKISLRSIEELTGISPVHKKKKDDNHEEIIDVNRSRVTNTFEALYKQNDIGQASANVKANVSPKMLKGKNRPKKRDRSMSLDLVAIKKNRIQEDSLAKEQDINFVEKASAFMDRQNLMCTYCKKHYPTFAILLWHMSGHFSWFRFQCSRCSFISFSKSDCSKHAKKFHGIERRDLDSVVLPIPNWKIALMAHEFQDISEENDLSGKHTDEVIADCEDDVIEEGNKSALQVEDDEIMGPLFVDAEGNENITLDVPLPIIDLVHQVKIESVNNIDEKMDKVIDIIQDSNDSYLLEEDYTADTLENGRCFVQDENSTDGAVYDKFEVVFLDKIKEEDESDFYDELFTTTFPNNGFEKLIGVEDSIDSDNLKDDGLETIQESNGSNPIVNTRPTRNRTKSIKTCHNDFFYDFDNKTFKACELPNVKTNNTQKIKKNPMGICSKSKSVSPKSTKIS